MRPIIHFHNAHFVFAPVFATFSPLSIFNPRQDCQNITITGKTTTSSAHGAETSASAHAKVAG
jgi:hypothetical protein